MPKTILDIHLGMPNTMFNTQHNANRENKMPVANWSFGDRALDEGFARIFGGFHSEACKQELIGKKADSIAEDITASLLTDDSEAIEIAGDMLGFMEPEAMARLIRYALRNDVGHLRLELLAAMDESVKRTADMRAIRFVDGE